MIVEEHGKAEDENDPFENRKNQFNYSERAAQTFNNPLRERCVSTKPPKVINFSGCVTQWEIYDRYMGDVMQIAEQELLKGQEKEGVGPVQTLAMPPRIRVPPRVMTWYTLKGWAMR